MQIIYNQNVNGTKIPVKTYGLIRDQVEILKGI